MNKYIVTAGICLVLLSLFAVGMQGQEVQGKVLIVNSGNSVERYNAVQREFSANYPLKKVYINMDDKSIDEKKIKETIQNEAPDIIYCIGSMAYVSTYKHADNRPLIFSSLINWHRLPMNKNTYGIDNAMPAKLQMSMFRYFFPELKNIGVVYDEKYNKEWVDKAVKEGNVLGLHIEVKSITDARTLQSSLKKLLETVDALWLIPDPGVMSDKQSIDILLRQSAASKKPVFAYDAVFENDAAFVIYADAPTIGRQSAALALDIIRKNPITDKVQNPAGSYIIVNLKKAKASGLKLNTDALDSATRVIGEEGKGER
ncbi:ABC transporter substrate binding protein [Candidatus Magnetobacterium bavaricum]|uniref:ABC transporter substrate binding protein n=1 Tax=Candidatus Magnetobacterium bavaricum TaxID=29290 RepID=A0A0F3GS12_9BACT|nr:ABC transporter substrate binding protein [Candidatus Magnetobacterium bavaricum]